MSSVFVRNLPRELCLPSGDIPASGGDGGGMTVSSCRQGRSHPVDSPTRAAIEKAEALDESWGLVTGRATVTPG